MQYMFNFVIYPNEGGLDLDATSSVAVISPPSPINARSKTCRWDMFLEAAFDPLLLQKATKARHKTRASSRCGSATTSSVAGGDLWRRLFSTCVTLDQMMWPQEIEARGPKWENKRTHRSFHDPPSSSHSV
jgi:hypothetical protein